MEKITNKKWFKVFEVFIILFLFALLLPLSSVDKIFIIPLIPLCIIPIIVLSSLFKKIKPSFKKCFNKENKRLCFVLIMIFIVIVFSICVLIRLYRNINIVNEIADALKIDVSIQEINFLFNLAFKKIALFAGIVFGGTFLVLKALRKEK